MQQPNPLDYHRVPPGTPNVMRNFLFGLLGGLLTSGCGLGMGWLSKNGNIFMEIVVVLIVGKIAAAIYFTWQRRYRGVAVGLILSMGVVALVFGGICFAAIQNL